VNECKPLVRGGGGRRRDPVGGGARRVQRPGGGPAAAGGRAHRRRPRRGRGGQGFTDLETKSKKREHFKMMTIARML